MTRRTLLGAVAAMLMTGGALAAQPSSSGGGLRVLHPGDSVRIAVWKQPELSGGFIVTNDGTLGHPLYQSVVVAGVPIDSVRSRIGRFLLQYVQAPQFVVETFVRVYVRGEVRAPGAQAVPAQATLLQVMAAAGGPTERARLDRVLLVRHGAVTQVDLTRLGDPVGDSPVYSGDQVVVQRRRNMLSEVVGPIAGIIGALAAITTIFLR